MKEQKVIVVDLSNAVDAYESTINEIIDSVFGKPSKEQKRLNQGHLVVFSRENDDGTVTYRCEDPEHKFSVTLLNKFPGGKRPDNMMVALSVDVTDETFTDYQKRPKPPTDHNGHLGGSEKIDA